MVFTANEDPKMNTFYIPVRTEEFFPHTLIQPVFLLPYLYVFLPGAVPIQSHMLVNTRGAKVQTERLNGGGR